MADGRSRPNATAFKNGNPGGPGRPPRKKEERVLELLAECVTDDDWRDIFKKMVTDAKKGWVNARRDLLNYVIGKPTQMIDLNMNESPLMQLLQEWRDEDEARLAAAAAVAEAEAEAADDESGA